MTTKRQDRTRTLKTRFLLLSVVTFSIISTLYYIESRRSALLGRAQRATEIRELDDRFNEEAERVKSRLDSLKTEGLLPHTVFSARVPGVRRFIILDSGRVIAHSEPSEEGSIERSLAEKIIASKIHQISTYSWEGFPTTLRFTRLPKWGGYFVMEKVHAPVRAGLSPMFLIVLAAGGTLGFLFLWTAFFKTEPEAEVRQPVVVEAPPELNSELGRFIAAREGRSDRDELKRLRRARVMISSFEMAARRARSTEELGEKLVKTVSSATERPAFFFLFDPRQGIARLSTESGASFALSHDVVSSVHAEASRGKLKNLENYAPLARVMRTRFGLTKFEAWPMTESRSLNSGPSRLLGVLVVDGGSAENRVESALHPEFLRSIMLARAPNSR